MTDVVNKKSLSIVQITCGVALALMLGWLLVVGKSIILPVLIAAIAVFVLTTAADKMRAVPWLGHMLQSSRRAYVGMLFLLIISALTVLVLANMQAISEAAPRYSSNLNALFSELATAMGMKSTEAFTPLLNKLEEMVSIGDVIKHLLSGISGFGAFLFSALLYSAFLLADWNGFPQKMRLALNDETSSNKALATWEKISARIGGYLSAKTLINGILGLVSFFVMWAIGIEFAVFWAVLIALLNYIPYVGSILGVLFPTVLALAQFGSFGHAAICMVLLLTAQLIVGNVVEPKMLGKTVNMSPFVLLIALSFWTSVWGLVGAILAIPLTAIVMIVLAEIPDTRPIAVMMSGNGDV